MAKEAEMEQPHILLVEDDATARMLLADVLGGASYRVTMAQDGEKALELLDMYSFDTVITDIRMRSVDGVQVLQAARNCEMPPPVILLTGYGSLETAVAALRSGAYDYLLKPVAPQDLLERVAGAIAHRMSERRQDEAVRIISEGLAQLRGQASPRNNPEEHGIHSALDSQETSVRPSSLPQSEQGGAETGPRYVRVGLLTIDNFRHTASFDDQPLHLTPIEYAMLRCLAESAGRVVSYREIVRCSHGHDTDEAEAQSLLKAHIRNVRRKIPPEYLVNSRGVGYMLVEPTNQKSS